MTRRESIGKSYLKIANRAGRIPQNFPKDTTFPQNTKFLSVASTGRIRQTVFRPETGKRLRPEPAFRLSRLPAPYNRAH